MERRRRNDDVLPEYKAWAIAENRKAESPNPESTIPVVVARWVRVLHVKGNGYTKGGHAPLDQENSLPWNLSNWIVLHFLQPLS
jgi:hypothetical protein